MKNSIFTLIAMLSIAGAASAQTTTKTENKLRWLAGMSLTVGGDKLATVRYTDGTSETDRAGELIQFTGGAEYQVTPEFAVQASLNFHAAGIGAKNGGTKFYRYPVEAFGYYAINKEWRIGAGVRYVPGTSYSGSGAASGIGKINFDSTVSGILEVEYLTSPRGSVKLRYVKESFTLTDSKTKVDGSHLGIGVSYYW